MSQNEHLEAIFIERDNYITRLIENLGLAVKDMKQTINTQEFFSEEDSSFINYDKYYRIENLGRNAPLTIIIFGFVGFFMAIICSIILFIYHNQMTQTTRTQLK